ncbi:hypothetical protein [Streptomyces sp. NPDC048489]|uniref:hypothetical protein n=1 Tax=Streptomyces sp. NPDC048489 TaxID=3154504 RepID=UPI003414CAAD
MSTPSTAAVCGVSDVVEGGDADLVAGHVAAGLPRNQVKIYTPSAISELISMAVRRVGMTSVSRFTPLSTSIAAKFIPMKIPNKNLKGPLTTHTQYRQIEKGGRERPPFSNQ